MVWYVHSNLYSVFKSRLPVQVPVPGHKRAVREVATNMPLPSASNDLKSHTIVIELRDLDLWPFWPSNWWAMLPAARTTFRSILVLLLLRLRLVESWANTHQTDDVTL